MELSKITIDNFKSIKNATIEFNHNCIILLGKNEAGKSNALKAVAAVFEKYQLKNKDKRKRINNEIINTYKITAVLRLSPGDVDSVVKAFNDKFLGTENIVFRNGKSIKNYVENVFHELLIEIDVKDNTKQKFKYSEYNGDDYSLITTLYVNGNEIRTDSGIEFILKDELFNTVVSLYLQNPFRCLYWQYSKDFLLPNSVEINDFIQEPSTCKSLENIFILCNRENIRKEFEDSKSQDGDYSNLLEQVSDSVTEIFRSIWDDLKDTSIQLIPNGDEMLIKVVNQTKYSFEERSEGFKKFISILLMLSTQSRADKINAKDIIIIDEPDQSLYPTSARYLRDELLNIAKKAKIIYSTHSQYMIDDECLDRHLIVEKKNDVTIIKREDGNAPYYSDELLRRAIGTTIFECLKPVNLIFEGWLDKELFKRYCSFNQKSELFEKHGAVYLSGISGVETLVQILVLANKKFLIIADSDKTSNNKKSDFIDKYKEFEDRWLGYGDVCSRISTMEDFINQEYIQEIIRNDGHAEFDYDSSKSTIENIDKVANQDKTVKQRIKNKIIETLSNENILTDYEHYFTEVLRRLERM